MGGRLHLYLDGDLFRVTVEFPRIAKRETKAEEPEQEMDASVNG